MRAVDTNVLVRLIVQDDARQYEAAKKFVAKGAWVTHLVLGETTWVLKALYLLSDAQILTAIEMLLNHMDITVQDADAVAAALEQYRAKPKLGFTDCLILEAARKAGHLPLGTFDQKLRKLEGATQP